MKKMKRLSRVTESSVVVDPSDFTDPSVVVVVDPVSVVISLTASTLIKLMKTTKSDSMRTSF
jgi:hypothetical protein